MKKLTKSMLLVAAMCSMGASAMADESPSWTYYYRDHARHYGTEVSHQMSFKTRTIPSAADFTNNGKMKLVYGGQNNNEWMCNKWDEAANDSAGGWAWQWYANWENSAVVVELGDWDADPVRLDFKEGGEASDVYGIPTSTFSFFRWIDFNNDGNLDLIVFGKKDFDSKGIEDGDYYAFIYQNGGSDAGYKFSKVDKAPFNLTDGKPNFNPNDGNWNGDDSHYGNANRGISFGDINNDGLVDFVCQNYGCGLAVYLGNGDGSFTQNVQLADSYREGDIKLADFDADGNLDFVTSAWSSDGEAVRFYRGNGDGTFDLANPEGYAKGIRSSSVAVADFTNDGNLDILIVGWEDNGRGWTSDFYANKGGVLPDGTFNMERKESPIPDWIDNCVSYAFDIDNDGNIDVMMNHGDNLKWWKGNGDGTFNSTGYIDNDASENKGMGGYSFGDLYNTGSLDMVGQWKHGDNGWLKTMHGVANERPTAPTALTATYADGRVALTWTAGTDDKTPQAGLSYNVFVKYGDVVRTLVPAHTDGDLSGRLKVVQDMQTLVRGTAYTLTLPEDVRGEVVLGVSTVDGVFAPSAFATTSVYIPTPGDVNKDGTVSLADLTALVNILLEEEGESTLEDESMSEDDNTSDYDRTAADLNGDGELTADDLAMLVSLILAQ